MKNDAMHAAELSDADLVAESLSGNRDAFGRIVEQYQTLILSLAFLLAALLAGVENLHGAEPEATNAFSSTTNSLTDAEIKTMLEDAIDCDKLGVGLAVGVLDASGSRVLCHGKKDCRSAEPVDGDTLFDIGSITKVFTKALLFNMVARGEMKLDDPVQKYLPSSVRMPTHRGKEITLRHLAEHTSGLPCDALNNTPRTWRNPYADYTLEQLYSFLSTYKLRRDPGAKFEYSNFGVALLAHVIALKAGKDYETLVMERICRPLKMDSTRILDSTRITLTPNLQRNMAIPHELPDRPTVNWTFQTLLGAGSIHSSVNDMLKFASAWLGLTPSSLTPFLQQWGYGHEGGGAGFRADIAFDTDRRRAVVVLCNCGRGNVVGKLVAGLLKNRPAKPVGAVPANLAAYDAYAGQYRGRDGAVLVVHRLGDRLFFSLMSPSQHYRRSVSYEVFPLSQTVFTNQMYEFQLAFVPNASGKAGQLTLALLHKPVWKAKRIQDEPLAPLNTPKAAPELYDQYAGDYRIALGPFHVGPVIKVGHEIDALGDHLMVCLSKPYQGVVGGCEVYPMADDVFVSPGSANLELRFVRTSKGRVKSMIARMDNDKGRLVKVTPPPP